MFSVCSMLITQQAPRKQIFFGQAQYIHVYYAPMNVGNFCCLERQTCPRVRDIESLYFACAIRIVCVCGVQCSTVQCQAKPGTLFDDQYVCYSLRVGPRLVAILL